MMDSLADIFLLTGLGAAAALLLVSARSRLAPRTDTLLELINRQLPQTQCAQCGYPGCRPYAQAIVNGEAINRCPPGGEQTITILAELLGRPPVPLDTNCGSPTTVPQVARIREEECIGCTLCIAACPVDAILGAHTLMHTVIASACTGCDLCREPCPVDCIDLVEQPLAPWEILQTAFPDFETPCINCGLCAQECPRQLQPQLLHWFREDIAATDRLNLAACIVCGRCDKVCPSGIPLTDTFKAAKNRKRDLVRKNSLAARSEKRFVERTQRLESADKRVASRPSKADRLKLLNPARDLH